MHRAILLLMLLAFIPAASAADSVWHAAADGCADGYYAFTVTLADGPAITLGWRSGPDRGEVRLGPARPRWQITTIDRDLIVGGRHVRNYARCIGSREISGSVYLVAALDVVGGVWYCNEYPVAMTPGESLRWHGQEISVTVLILSDYIGPEDCAVEGVGPAWYVDWGRYTCLAYLGEDRNCPGEAHYH